MSEETKLPITQDSETEQDEGRCAPATCSVSASEVRAILNATDWDKFWQNVAEAAAPEIEAYRQAEARSRNINHVFV